MSDAQPDMETIIRQGIQPTNRGGWSAFVDIKTTTLCSLGKGILYAYCEHGTMEN